VTEAAPVISVVIPTYNRRHVIDRAVKSVLGQSMARFELIVVDDGSTDGTADYLRDVYRDPRLQVIVQANAGVCAARNTGIAAASCHFITFLDSDDEAGDGWLAFFGGAVLEYDLASCGVHFVGPGTAYKAVLPEVTDKSMGGITARYLAGAFAMRTSMLRAVGGFRTGMRFSEHTDLALRIGALLLVDPLRITATDDRLLTMHREERPYDAALQYESSMMLLREDAEHLMRSRMLHATYLAIAGVAASRLGRHGESRRLLWRATCTDPLRPKHAVRLLREAVTRR
jgi:glycosyltransferase involved in cell wall biosynthesis